MALQRYDSRGVVAPWIKNEHLARYDFASRFTKNKVVLDVACGDATGSAKYAQSGARQVMAYDIDAPSVERARHVHSGVKNLNFNISDCCHLDAKNQEADVFISLETIEHIQADKDFLKEVARCLTPDGIFICSTPNRDVTNPGTRIQDKPFNRFHVREYTREEFHAMLKNFFLEIEIFGQNPVSASLVRKLSSLRKVLPGSAILFIQRLMKLPWFFGDTPSRHAVIRESSGTFYEYHVAVCSRPKALAL